MGRLALQAEGEHPSEAVPWVRPTVVRGTNWPHYFSLFLYFPPSLPGLSAFPVYLSQVPGVGLSLNLFLQPSRTHTCTHTRTHAPLPPPFPSLGAGPFILSLGDLRCRCRKCLSAQAAAAGPCGFDKPHLIGRKPGEFERTETATTLLLSGII